MASYSEGSASGDSPALNFTEPATLEPPYSESAVWLRAVHSTVALILMTVSIMGNAILAIAVVKYKKLRHRSIIASMGTVAINFLAAAVTNPQVLAGSVTGEWPFRDAGCTVAGYLSVSFFYVRWLNNFLIAVDRFLSVSCPFFYARNCKYILVPFTIVVWTFPFISDLPTLWLLGGFSYRSTLTFCAIECGEDTSCVVWYIGLFAVYVLLGMVVPTCLYLYLYCLGVKKKREMRRELGTQGEDPVTHHSSESEKLESVNSEERDIFEKTNGELIHFPPPPLLPAVNLPRIAEEGEGEEIEREIESEKTVLKFAPIDVSSPLELELETDADRLEELECAEERKGGEMVADTAEQERGGEMRDWIETSRQSSSKHNMNGYADSEINGKIAKTHENVTSGTDLELEGKLPAPKSKENEETKERLKKNRGRRSSIMLLSRTALSYVVPASRISAQIREGHAIKTFILIFISFVVTQIPIFLLSVVRRASFFPLIPIWFHLVCVNLFLLSPALDPVIIMRNRDFRNVLKKMFCRQKQFSSFTPYTSRTQ